MRIKFNKLKIQWNRDPNCFYGKYLPQKNVKVIGKFYKLLLPLKNIKTVGNLDSSIANQLISAKYYCVVEDVENMARKFNVKKSRTNYYKNKIKSI